jgi:hypothetical protein
MRWVRSAIITVGLAMAALVGAPPAWAAPPPNDTFGGATVISTLPFSDTVDTTQATTDADDAEANADCGAPATEASVWYSFTESTDSSRTADVSGSDYSAGVIVVTGAPGSFSVVTCGAGTVVFDTTAGQTYRLLAFDDTPGAGNGGTLQFSLSEAPPPPEVHLTVDPTGRFNANTGVATVTGTFTCSNASEAGVFTFLSQQVGRFTISGAEDTFGLAPCDGAAHPWSANVHPFDGKFKGGKARVEADISACDGGQCGSDQVTRTIQLRGGR